VLDIADQTDEDDLSPTELLVLLALAARHNDRDYHCAYGQLERMAKDTHLHVVTLSRVLSQLEDKHFITVWEGQLPRRKGDPDDGRRTRGTMWCFVGLDADDGPNIEGCVPRVKRGGRPPKTELADGKLISGDELARNGRSVSRNGADELAGGEAKQADELAGRNTVLLTGYEVKPEKKNHVEPARARAREDESICPRCRVHIDDRGRGHQFEYVGESSKACGFRFLPPDVWRSELARASPVGASP